jgi:hypothetical protein
MFSLFIAKNSLMIIQNGLADLKTHPGTLKRRKNIPGIKQNGRHSPILATVKLIRDNFLTSGHRKMILVLKPMFSGPRKSFIPLDLLLVSLYYTKL